MSLRYLTAGESHRRALVGIIKGVPAALDLDAEAIHAQLKRRKLGYGRGNRITLTHEIRFPHSLGLLYSAFTSYTGFKVNSGEYKVMGLAPYGEPKYADLILKNLLDLKDDGSFRMDMSYFNYGQGLTMTSANVHRLFGGPPRKPESPLTQKEMDLAASVQAVTEEIVLRHADELGLHDVEGVYEVAGDVTPDDFPLD